MALDAEAPRVERFLSDWLPAPTKAEVVATYTHHSHARRYRSREAPLKYALHRIADDGAQRPVMQQWLRHIAHTCPGSFYLPRFDASDILAVVGCARGAPNTRTKDAMLASAVRRDMEDLALHELGWDDLMAVLLSAEPLVLRVVVDDRTADVSGAAQKQSPVPTGNKKRPRDDGERACSDGGDSGELPSALLDPNPFQFRLLALAIRRFRKRHETQSASAPSGAAERVLPVLVSITWWNPKKKTFHAHMCALSIEAAASSAAAASATGGAGAGVELVAILYDPIPPGVQAQKAERARSEIATLLRRVLAQPQVSSNALLPCLK
eukprot:COSAG06_NODE_850_length_11961_cov_34.663126_11_plen_324_part_00